MHEAMLPQWQIWAIVFGGGFGTLAVRLAPLILGNALSGERTRAFFERAGYGVLGGIVATGALKAGQASFTGPPLAGPVIALMCVGVAFGLAAWRGGTLLPTLAALALFVLADTLI
ncbi:AzlD domain-containing protein [Consotaella aegiceratis]|uniref:AzlD domain-containing protein n=1 Tax=Consotaella aegiceratis TaxID=3097961 RepID=UPI002F42CD27